MENESSALRQLKERIAVIEDLKGASSVLAWDQETYMPPGGIESRATQLATLKRIIHERFTSDEVGELIETVETDHRADLSEIDRDLIRVVRRDFDRLVKLPANLVERIAETTSRAMPAWNRARADSDFRQFRPHLEAIVGLCREKAEAIGYDADPYDPLVDEFEPGITTAEVEREFTELRRGLVPIVEAIAERESPADGVLRQPYDEQKQWDFGLAVIRDFGFDFEHGRQDRSAHPFTIHFSSSDVRITTRIRGDYFSPGFFGTLHEAGHALYEQGISPELARTPLAHGTSLGLHESQSRLWENLVGRSRRFWTRYYPDLRAVFPAQLEDVAEDTFYRAVNRVAPSLIRVEADEVTYNLHVMLRFELERALVQDDLRVADLPGAWNEKMETYLGLSPPDDARGVLQDIHWSMGAIGYFPTYSLGTLMSTQIFAAARESVADMDSQIAGGDFRPLLEWLQDNIYRFGRRYDAQRMLRKVTGSRLDSSHWLAYIRAKFEGIYGALP